MFPATERQHVIAVVRQRKGFTLVGLAPEGSGTDQSKHSKEQSNQSQCGTDVVLKPIPIVLTSGSQVIALSVV